MCVCVHLCLLLCGRWCLRVARAEGHGASEFAREASTPEAEGGSTSIDMIDVPLNMSIDMGDPYVKTSPLGHFFCCVCSCFSFFFSTETLQNNEKSPSLPLASHPFLFGFCLLLNHPPTPSLGIPLPLPR
jgi:hypothetical protein